MSFGLFVHTVLIAFDTDLSVDPTCIETIESLLVRIHDLVFWALRLRRLPERTFPQDLQKDLPDDGSLARPDWRVIAFATD